MRAPLYRRILRRIRWEAEIEAWRLLQWWERRWERLRE